MELPDITMLFSQWTALIGFGALIAVLINIGKALKIVKDGTATIWSTGLNLIGFIVLVVLRVVQPDFSFESLDPVAQNIATVLSSIFGIILQLLGSYGTHTRLAGVPVIGKSFTLERQKLSVPPGP